MQLSRDEPGLVLHEGCIACPALDSSGFRGIDDVAESWRAEGVIYAPIAERRVPFIDTRDIATVAAEVLLQYLTGARADMASEVVRA
jgi:uncharacterized protein YbjT (DUF2867 family)